MRVLVKTMTGQPFGFHGALYTHIPLQNLRILDDEYSTENVILQFHQRILDPASQLLPFSGHMRHGASESATAASLQRQARV
jgi:hypothetical protein